MCSHLLHNVPDFYVYILYSKSLDKYYVGQTQDLTKRMEDHLNSRSPYTKSSKDWKLVYQEEFSSRKKSLSREREIKSNESRKYMEYLIGKG
ncbi:GIY-YIG nuclease family protein [Moheibacter stercoris]|uniref:GIY-YIG nuclease family protein n=1 Tax=Moheibacter stercoris TaxID=1628251 RepID=UPI003397F900